MIVDISASMDAARRHRALDVLASVAIDPLGAQAELWACDTRVGEHGSLRLALNKPLPSGGGTDLRVAIEAGDRRLPRPDLVVLVTDGRSPGRLRRLLRRYWQSSSVARIRAPDRMKVVDLAESQASADRCRSISAKLPDLAKP